ncbi:hypothetical protein CEE37_01120 [candidate division LCP-89 bacterium B3_LCP]|uniref:Uncharacterized protein n=1 Tax=candidate division LCP-89 bacterium B3_LCP TaxID=2012998 RepID=A0A532V542_UNCL8|nr:MAG: hypothetical protein CEE37_01120 [candidate division LCP-89 bacterium B3_LCP]
MSTRKGGFRLVLIIAVLAILLISTLPAGATQFSGGKGLTMVQFPTLLPPGALNIKLHTRAFAKSLNNYTLSNGTGAVSFNFGFTKHVELGLTQILYQDLNLSARNPNNLEQIPDDTYIRVKVGNFPFTIGNNYFKFGILNQLRYRTGIVDNIYLEPYVSSGIEWEMDIMISYFSNPLYEENALAVHFNLGYLNHNDAGIDTSMFKASQELIYGLACVYPTRMFDFYLENSGSFFTNYPKEFIYSRENSIWMTPGLRYKMFYGVSLTLAADILLYQEDERSTPVLPGELPNYPSWRMNGVISFNPSTTFYKQPTFSTVDDPKTLRKMLRERKSLFEWVVDEQEGLEYIDLELEKIKAERKKAEEELEQLKQELGVQ